MTILKEMAVTTEQKHRCGKDCGKVTFTIVSGGVDVNFEIFKCGYITIDSSMYGDFITALLCNVQADPMISILEVKAR